MQHVNVPQQSSPYTDLQIWTRRIDRFVDRLKWLFIDLLTPEWCTSHNDKMHTSPVIVILEIANTSDGRKGHVFFPAQQSAKSLLRGQSLEP